MNDLSLKQNKQIFNIDCPHTQQLNMLSYIHQLTPQANFLFPSYSFYSSFAHFELLTRASSQT